MSFLVTAGYGPASGSGQIVYTGGSTQPFTLSSTGWRVASGSPSLHISR
ncbi:MAG: hypothetical protein ACRDNW_27770 [Trebonia sp.]